MTHYAVVVDPRQQLAQLARSLNLAINYQPVLDRTTRLYGCTIFKQALGDHNNWHAVVSIQGQPSQDYAEVQAATSALSILAAATIPMAITHFNNGY
jgi:hypothetical protein